MDWERDLPNWPNSALSRRITCRPHRWHVQEAGQGKTVLLLHGAGGSTHSWRDLIGPLAQHYHVVAVDLPGQGFTQMGTKGRCGLRQMAEDLGALCDAQGWSPTAIISHSAGGALALELARTRALKVVSVNPALAEFSGVAGWLFPFLAKLLALNPLTPWLFTIGAGSPNRARRLIEGTGSKINDEGLALYGKLIADRSHVDGALRMMAQWSLGPLLRDLPRIDAPCLFLIGTNDKAVTPDSVRSAAARLHHAQITEFDGLGHLAHEEDPQAILARILHWLS